MLKTAIFVSTLIVYIFIVRIGFKELFKAKSTVGLKFAKSLTLIVGVTIITYSYLNQFEATKDISKTLLQSGSLIIALATFSCQQVLGNIISGLMLSAMKPFEIGDKITLISTSGSIVTEGVVKSMNIRHVTFQKPDGKIDYVSNAVVDSCIIENSNVSVNNGRMFVIECDFESDVDRAIEIVGEMVETCPFTVSKDTAEVPAAKIRCANITPNGYEIKTCVWAANIDDSFDAFDWLNRNVPKAWAKENIHIPYNTVSIKEDVNVKKN